MEEMTDERQDALTRLTRELAGAADPLERLGALRRLDGWLIQAKEETVATALRDKASFAEIGTALGVTRQSAHAKYRGLSPDAPTSVPKDETPCGATALQTPLSRAAVAEWALTTPGGRTLLRLISTRNGPQRRGPRAD